MTLQQLQYVLALDTHRHFVKAAQSCFVTQPTLTLQVKKLEDEIGLILFDRSRQPLEVTPMGEAFLQKARRIINEVLELKELVNQDRNQIAGNFKVGIIPTLSPYLLPRFINDFIRSNQETKLIVEEIQSERLIDQLIRREFDIGILATPLNEPDLVEIPLFYEPFVVYADEGNDLLNLAEVSKESLKPNGLWILKKGHCFRNQTLNICEFESSERHKNLEIEGGSIDTLKRMIQQVSGYTLIPDLSVNGELDRPHIVRFTEPQPVREISIVVHKHFSKDRLVDELMQSILQNIPKNFHRNNHFRTVNWR